MSTTPVTPWYKQFWPWFLLGLLMTSVTVSTTMLVIAVRSADGMVQEDYYEHGRAINMILAKQQRAAELNLAGDLRIDDQTGDITLDLAGDDRPERLILKLLFPTRDDRDQAFTLEHVRDGRYVGQAEERLAYRWYLQLQPDQETPEWRLSGEATFPADEAIVLAPGGPG
ncbi:FixH family protein [Halomonas salipaludis]|uniref:Nitrogen fixation protein FixH n=1 Tax=Halomonas salipaludis TaxID=2032625 RepID=A0A2A2EV30_9GAMM|nr:FixH family protein [Halomonas salipaludis]PAU76207.1 hypothetical protein CK498_15105 [Halomonas salipaludis]